MNQKTLYGLSKNECNILCNTFNNDTNKLALILWNKGKANSLESAVKRAIKIKKFALC